VALRGHAVAWGLVVSPTGLEFGFTTGPNPNTRCISLTNIANVPIHLTADPAVLNVDSTGELSPAGPFQPAAPSWPDKDTQGGPGEILLLCVTFTPVGCPSKFMGEIDISTDDASESNIKIPLTGFSGGAVVLCSPQGLDFGLNACGTPWTLSVLCTNIGQNVPGDPGGNLVVWGLSFQNSDPAFTAAFDRPPPDAGLAAGESVKIDVTFAPTQPGAHSDTLLIFTNDACDPQPAIAVSGVCQ